jgi:hypothetical protein
VLGAILYTLIRHESLSKDETRKKLGNLYLNLKVTKPELLYGFLFYLQRLAIVVVIVAAKTFSA